MTDDTTTTAATLRALELPTLLSLVADLAATDLGRERLESLRLFRSEEALRRHHRRYDEVRRLLAARKLVPSREREIGPILAAVTSGRERLVGLDMVEIAAFLRATGEAAERVAGADPVCPALAETTDALPDLGDLRRLLKKTFDRRGEIRETPRRAWPSCAAASARADSLYDELRTMVDQTAST